MQYEQFLNSSESFLQAAHEQAQQASSNSDIYVAPPLHIDHHDLTDLTPNQSLFNTHEIWAISIATICFVVGFPSNLISIIVCLRSLVRKPVLTRQRFQVHHKNGACNNYRGGGVYKAVHRREMNQNGYVDQPVSMSLITQDNYNNNNNNNNQQAERYQFVANNLNGARNGSFQSGRRGGRNSRCRLLINLKLKNERKDSTKSLPPSKGGFSAIKLVRNPHRHCFELYLIEICFCDIFILAYFFLECVLLVLSRFKLIDSMYAEPVLISKFMCQFIIGFNRTIILIHNWLVSSLALTRCYAIYKPLNSTANFGQKFYLRLNLFVLFMLILLFSTLNIIGVMPLEYQRYKFGIFRFMRTTISILGLLFGRLDLSRNETLEANGSTSMPRNVCKISETWYSKIKNIEVYINLTLGVIGYSLPCIITLIINLILIYNIRNINMFRSPINKQQSQQSTASTTYANGGSINTNMSSYGGAGSSIINSSGSKQYFKSRNQFVKTTSSLLTLSLSYLVCYLPYSFLFFFMSLDLAHFNHNLIFAFFCLKYLNHTLNFFIYFATGKRFRNEVIAFLGFQK